MCTPTHWAVAILTHLVVAGSEIVAGWEGVMSTSTLSDTFPGNLAGAARLWSPEQGGSKVVTATGWGDGLTWDKALHQLPLLQLGKVALELLAWDFQWDFFPCGHRYPQVTHGFLHSPTQNVPSSSF